MSSVDRSILRALVVLATGYSSYLSTTPPNPPATKEEKREYEENSPGNPIPLSMTGTFLSLVHRVAVFCPIALEITAIAADQLPWLQDAIGADSAAPLLRFLRGNNASIFLSTSSAIGAALAAVGTLIRVACYRRMAKHFTFELSIKKDHQLVQDGPYAIVRHPSYTGFYMYLAGLMMVVLGRGSWWTERYGGRLRVLYAVGMVGIYGLPIIKRCVVEDAVLRSHFKEEWDRWARHTPYRIVPFVF